MAGIVIAVGILAGLGLVFGLVLALADRHLRVEEDPRIEQVERLLPGSNCGACGQPGCRALAERIVASEEKPSRCTVSAPGGLEAIADFLGVDVGAAEKRVARVHCGGGLGRARQLASYEGFDSCRGAHLVGGGGLECSWGCLGLADCVRSCTFDAMRMNAFLLPVVDVDKCTACGDCVEACPRDLIDLLPISHHLIVQCRAPLAAEAARRICSAACDACERCAADAATGLIQMANNLPVVDYGAGGPAEPRATFRCPTGAIRWVEGAQFAEDDWPVAPERPAEPAERARRAHV